MAGTGHPNKNEPIQAREVAGAALVLATAAADLAAFGMLLIRGGRAGRLLAGAAIALHTGAVVYVQHRRRRIRAAHLAADGAR
jgi:hypothetical protein